MTIKEIMHMTRDRMNDNETYTEGIFPEGSAGLTQKLIEIEFKKTFKNEYPHAGIIHPADNSGLPDIWSEYYGHGIEVKCTKGWPTYYYKKDGTRIKTSDDHRVVWTQGTIQQSDEKFPFWFVKFSIINNELKFDYAYFGLLSYNDWTIHKGQKGIETDMRITLSKVKKLCKQIY